MSLVVLGKEGQLCSRPRLIGIQTMRELATLSNPETSNHMSFS